MSHEPPETVASGHQLIEAVRRGNSLSAWISASAFVAFSPASAPETLVLFGHT